jgi:hypothetical protein
MMTPEPGVRDQLSLGRFALACAVALLGGGRAFAFHGYSDAGATRACWLERPYALVKCKTSRTAGEFHYPAQLVRGRDVLPDDAVMDHDGIVTVEVVMDDIDRLAITPRYLIAELRPIRYKKGESDDWQELRPFAVLDLTDARATPVRFDSREDLEAFLRGRPDVPVPLRFQTFEEVYAERGPGWVSGYGLGYAVLLLLGGAGAFGAVAVWRSRRRAHAATHV